MAAADDLDMSALPPVFILPTHLQAEDLHEAEDMLYHAGGRLSYSAAEARIFLGKILQKKRAAFDLRSRGLWTQEESLPAAEPAAKQHKTRRASVHEAKTHPASSRSLDGDQEKLTRKRESSRLDPQLPDLTNHIVVLRLEWLDDCNKTNNILPFEQYVIYSGKIISKPADEKQTLSVNNGITYIKAIPESQVHGSTSTPDFTSAHARTDAAAHQRSPRSMPFHRRKFGQKPTFPIPNQSSNPPRLYRTTTSELEREDSSQLPPPPAWVIEKHPRPIYSCLRSTPPLETNLNRYFISQLEKIKEARLLTLDEIGVRAYSTSIASISAYPHRITSPLEITRLPGCNEKIAALWIEWHESISLSQHSDTPLSPSSNNDLNNSDQPTDHNDDNDNDNDNDATLDSTRTIPIVRSLLADPDLAHLRTFHNIWGVGPETARKFYFHNGWKDLDDVIEFGWSTLSRAQQIGVKFYDEFLLPIPRAEVEGIARTVLRHARRVKNIDERYWSNDVVEGRNGARQNEGTGMGDPRDFVAVLVGGYRRGKERCGDVDVILSHRDERFTKDLVVDVVRSLEGEGWITHTLSLVSASSDRDQQTLPYRGPGKGHGFDGLDKAFCVWQDQDQNQDLGPEKEQHNESLEGDDGESGCGSGSGGASDETKGRKNTNPHRRVDIIVSPWRTVGCAVLGWSGGTTFQRDLRRWVKQDRNWKFDSSGIRDRGTGVVLRLEEAGEGDGDSDGDGWEDRERRVMERVGIGWRPAVERCTG